jgi:hypothetical protein
MKSIAALAAGVIVFAGCAQMPPVVATYYPATTSLGLKVTRTVACDESNRPFIASSVTTSLSHAADTANPITFDPALLNSFFANGDMKVEFFADGRLKGLNATTTGQGKEIFDAVIKLATTQGEEVDSTAVEKACERLRTDYKDKPLTLFYETRDDLTGSSNNQPIPPDFQSATPDHDFKAIVGTVCLRFGKARSPATPIALKEGESKSGYAMLMARQPGLQELEVWAGAGSECGDGPIWSGAVLVAQKGTSYGIPIPKAELFGKQAFAAAFDESGALTSIQYVKEGGPATGIGAVQSVLDAGQTSTAEEIAGLKSEADLIAAQQRLVKCQATPAECK